MLKDEFEKKNNQKKGEIIAIKFVVQVMRLK
jgi:hypothetical protein